jgi:cytochrome c
MQFLKAVAIVSANRGQPVRRNRSASLARRGQIPTVASLAHWAGSTLQRILMFTSIFTAAFAVAVAAFAQVQFGTASEAKAMIERAIAELKTDEAAALAKFNKGADGFKDRDLYVFCYDMNTAKFTAHGANKLLIGTDVKTLKEKDGSSLGEKIFNATKANTITTVAYNFPRPGTTNPVPKESYVTRVGNEGCGVGYYK